MKDNFHFNQLGFRRRDKKIFMIDVPASSFQVINEASGKVVYENKIHEKCKDTSSGSTIFYGDFSMLREAGKYYISVPQIGKSYVFLIDDNVYTDVKNALLKAFYFQRCGTALEEKYADKWKHALCHNSIGILYEDENVKFNISGGWHDAGDYGKYVVAAAKAVSDLLISYELFPNSFKNTINIPESGNSIPDILNEVKFELDWLFKMQNTENGGVYTKATTKQFPGMVMPEEDTAPIYVYPVSSPATADFAAAMALASRIYKNFDEEYSKKCLAAAEKAFKWILENPSKLFKNPPDTGTGEYGDDSDVDEVYWASAELYKVTKNRDYLESFIKCFEKLEDINALGWADVAGYGSIAYLLTDRSIVDEAIYQKVKDKFIAHVNELVNISLKDGHRSTLKPGEYVWGSNMGILNNAMQLIIADIIKPDKLYIDTAIAQWNYIFGQNALNQSYVTGYGSNPILNPHHRPSVGDNISEPVPGLVSGGPCSWLADDCAKENLVGKSPEKCFIDNSASYSTNEITIYWNSPAVFVAGFLENQSLY